MSLTAKPKRSANKRTGTHTSLSGVTPRRTGRVATATAKVKATQSNASEGSYPKAKPRPKKKKNSQASTAAPKKAETKPEVKKTEKKPEASPTESIKAVPFVSYSNPQVSANYGDGNIEFSD